MSIPALFRAYTATDRTLTKETKATKKDTFRAVSPLKNRETTKDRRLRMVSKSTAYMYFVETPLTAKIKIMPMFINSNKRDSIKSTLSSMGTSTDCIV
ncbi:MAG: hypothetical protein ACP5P0_00135 [Hydrogenobacter sp.]